jgi:hypothetical protein
MPRRILIDAAIRVIIDAIHRIFTVAAIPVVVDTGVKWSRDDARLRGVRHVA